MSIKLSSAALSAISIPILALSLFTVNSMAAGKNQVARCVDANGDVTYTDFYCETTENSNPMLMTENAIERPVRSDHRYGIISNNKRGNTDRSSYGQDSHSQSSGKTSENSDDQNAPIEVVNSGPIAPTQLTAITLNAANRCSRYVTRFFRRKHPDVSSVPAIKFKELKDRFINGPVISVTLRANVEYDNQSSTKRSYIDCTAQNFSNNSSGDWKVGYLEPQANNSN
jgi:hypothetical protein